MFRNTHRLPKQMAAAIAVVALAAPATSAALPREAIDLRSPDAVDAAIEAQREEQAGVDVRSPDSKAADIEASRVAQSAPEPPEIAKAPGFDWGDAGIGAGSVFGLALISLSVMFAMVHRRRKVEGSEGSAITS